MAQNEGQQRASTAVAAEMARRGWNNTELVSAAGVDPGTIGDFLNGKRWPKLGTQGKIEKALGWPEGTLHKVSMGADAPSGSQQPLFELQGNWRREEFEGAAVHFDQNMHAIAIAELLARASEDQRAGKRTAVTDARNRLVHGAPLESTDREVLAEFVEEATRRDLVDRLLFVSADTLEQVRDLLDQIQDPMDIATRRDRYTTAAYQVKGSRGRSIRRLQDEAGEVPDPVGPDGGA